jgi:hypothetical protein
VPCVYLVYLAYRHIRYVECGTDTIDTRGAFLHPETGTLDPDQRGLARCNYVLSSRQSKYPDNLKRSCDCSGAGLLYVGVGQILVGNSRLIFSAEVTGWPRQVNDVSVKNEYYATILCREPSPISPSSNGTSQPARPRSSWTALTCS